MSSKPQHRKSFLLLYILLGYVIAQIIWWVYQIVSLSQQIDDSNTLADRKIRMLAGEFAVFIVILILGVVFIHRVFKKELKLSQSKKNFSLSITHELKTPITTSKLYMETLLEHSENFDQSKKLEIYQKVYNEQSRLQGLIEKILLSERVDNASIQINKSELNLADFVEGTLSSIEDAGRVGISIPSFITVSVDPFYFKSVVLNLVENALKYSQDEVTVIGEIKNGLTNLKVADTGRGIPNSEKDKVFNLYYRLEDEDVRTAKGTGLGLNLVKKLVKLHGGVVNVSDNVPNGTIFTVQLPS